MFVARCPRRVAFAAVVVSIAASSPVCAAEKHYDVGASDTEIKVGNISPYSGPASAFGTVGRVEAAYFKMLNDQGGINGRKINFISYDDGYSPPKAVEQARKLVESDEVLLLFGTVGTASNTAIRSYLNANKIPQILANVGTSKFGDPKNFPWTLAWNPTYRNEARVYVRYIMSNYPDKTIGILYQNDDFGKEYLKSIREALGEEADKKIAAAVPYEVTQPTIEAELVKIKAANPDILLDMASPKQVAQAIRKVAELNWKPVHIIPYLSTSIASVLKPAGLENSQGLLSSAYIKDANDPQWRDDPAIVQWSAFMDKYYPQGDKKDWLNVLGYGLAQALAQVLSQCSDDLTRENVMKHVTNMDFELGVLLPGIRVKTSPTDYYPLEQLQMMRFNKESWELFGPVVDGHEAAD